MYVVPAAGRLTAHVVRKDGGEYVLGLLGGSLAYGVEENSSAPGTVDRYEIVPDPRRRATRSA